LLEKYGNDKERIIKEYAAMEASGLVARKRNKNHMSPVEYAEWLYQDWERRKW